MKIGNLIKWEANERYGIVVDVGDNMVSISWMGYQFDPIKYYQNSLLTNTFQVIG